VSQAENHLELLDLATDHADREEVVTYNKRKPEEELGEAPTTRPGKKKKKEEERKLHNGNLVVALATTSAENKTFEAPLREDPRSPLPLS
jgi:hypothetical protein